MKYDLPNLEHSPDFSAFKSREIIFMILDHVDEEDKNSVTIRD